MRDILYEIGTEELPAGAIGPALEQLRDNFTKKALALKIGHGRVEVMGTPRRLSLLVLAVAERQEDIREELMGPSKAAGIDGSGKFTKAAEGFARGKNAQVDDLQLVTTPKGEYLQLIREIPGKNTAELLPELLHSLLTELSFSKSMRWGANLQAFCRPIQWLVALYGGDIVHFSHEGIASGNISRGHRFLADQPIVLADAASYTAVLRDHSVLVDIAERRAAVVREIQTAVAASSFPDSARVAVDEDLVDVVTNLVEMPFGVCGHFAEKFLQLPAEVLITSMREHQKSFPVVNPDGSLLPGFVAVNNTRVIDQAITTKGHERVLRARLEDALFFFNEDRQIPLADNRSRLAGIVFQAKLGTMLDKTERLVKLSRILAEKLAPNQVALVTQAASLCKADLISNMVGEFPTLQGVMGSAYASLAGEPAEVALAITEHYMPKRAGAALPTSTLGALVGIADRIDTIAGSFGIGQIPSGTADPFGLRRLSLAVLGIIAAKGFDLSLREITHKALALYGDKVDGSTATVDLIEKFLLGRFVNDYAAKGYDVGVIEAVTSVSFDNVKDVLARIDSFRAIRKEEAFPVLAASYKRIRNIIKDNTATEVAEELFVEEAERSLFRQFTAVRIEMNELLVRKDYEAALRVMLRMKQPVDTFFDDVMVMAEDPAVRRNRLNLLTAIGELILQIGDISRIQEGQAA